MHILPNSDPLVRARPFNPVTGSTITVGTISKIANSLAKSYETMNKLAADLGTRIADLNSRLDGLELLAAHRAKKSADDAIMIAHAKATVTPAEFAAMSRRNGWPQP